MVAGFQVDRKAADFKAQADPALRAHEDMIHLKIMPLLMIADMMMMMMIMIIMKRINQGTSALAHLHIPRLFHIQMLMYSTFGSVRRK
jgi:hypothetical protein